MDILCSSRPQFERILPVAVAWLPAFHDKWADTTLRLRAPGVTISRHPKMRNTSTRRLQQPVSIQNVPDLLRLAYSRKGDGMQIILKLDLKSHYLMHEGEGMHPKKRPLRITCLCVRCSSHHYLPLVDHKEATGCERTWFDESNWHCLGSWSCTTASPERTYSQFDIRYRAPAALGP